MHHKTELIWEQDIADVTEESKVLIQKASSFCVRILSGLTGSESDFTEARDTLINGFYGRIDSIFSILTTPLEALFDDAKNPFEMASVGKYSARLARIKLELREKLRTSIPEMYVSYPTINPTYIKK